MQNSPKKVFQHQHGCDVNADFVCLFEFSALFVRKQIIGELFLFAYTTILRKNSNAVHQSQS